MSSIPREALNTRAWKPGVIGGGELGAQCHRARDHFLRIGDIGRGDLVHHVGGRIAQHALGADIEYLNDAFLVGGDTREVGAVENRVLQGSRFEQSLFAADLGDDIHRAGASSAKHHWSICHVIVLSELLDSCR